MKYLALSCRRKIIVCHIEGGQSFWLIESNKRAEIKPRHMWLKMKKGTEEARRDRTFRHRSRQVPHISSNIFTKGKLKLAAEIRERRSVDDCIVLKNATKRDIMVDFTRASRIVRA